MARKAEAADAVLPFHIEAGGARGRLVRADLTAGAILDQHGYPEAVAMLLGEAVVLTALLGAAFKIDAGSPANRLRWAGKMLVVQYYACGDVRGYAGYDDERIAAAADAGRRVEARELLGSGSLAMTIDPGHGLERYQGVVELGGESLAEAANIYFQQSEQLPTYIRVAAARAYTGGGNGTHGNWTWRAGGLMVQKLTGEGGTAGEEDEDGEENWRRVRLLASTVEDHELLDRPCLGRPALPAVPRGRGARLRKDAGAGPLLMLARTRGGGARRLQRGRSRRHVGERHDYGEMRVLQRALHFPARCVLIACFLRPAGERIPPVPFLTRFPECTPLGARSEA
jgi:molecular chaperone Hsp33